ncbi:hypothetical protein ACTJK3_02990 [Pseudomonas sp. 22105]|jgi:hypothetical protein|uniref:Uncharacterized protein n=1 Tax=Pseudomonas fitomaticsae TaxID=2837969 RepID=A0ABY3Q0V6_9PSED|nr:MULTISPECIES: hypothetical protein [Pseudomonas]UFP99818.1 hypothetical protein KJY40_28060 [Pseudomonas fitomaticsae]
MIPVENPIVEPPGFDEKCRVKGNAWLVENPDAQRPRDFWSPFRLKLAEGFHDRCGYAAIFLTSGTVDHSASWNERPELAYEWSNYRYVDAWINSSKSKKRSADLLDPFEVGEGWFEIILPSLQLVVTDSVPDAFRARAENTLQQLPIRDDERVLRVRRKWLELYEQGRLDLEGLREMAPLIAAAIEKRDALASPPERPAPSRRKAREAYDHACVGAQQKVRELIRNNGNSNVNSRRWKLSVWAEVDDSQVVSTLIAMNLATSTGAQFCEISVGTVDTSIEFALSAANYAAEILTETLGPVFVANEPRE